MTGMTGGTASTVRRKAAPSSQSNRATVTNCLGCIGRSHEYPATPAACRQNARWEIHKAQGELRTSMSDTNVFIREMLLRVKPPAREPLVGARTAACGGEPAASMAAAGRPTSRDRQFETARRYDLFWTALSDR